tara:strand:- start:3397 stop:3810 length:414 start_codon:yes stop_codon:yes gene_type:complete
MQMINICYDSNFMSEDMENIDIRSIESIPNFSANKIMISFLNKIEKQQSIQIIQKLCNKLRQNGTLTFNLLDFDQLINFYQYEKLKLDDVVSHTKLIECFISKAEIIKMFYKHPQISIDSVTYDDMYSTYTLCRNSL